MRILGASARSPLSSGGSLSDRGAAPAGVPITPAVGTVDPTGEAPSTAGTPSTTGGTVSAGVTQGVIGTGGSRRLGGSGVRLVGVGDGVLAIVPTRLGGGSPRRLRRGRWPLGFGRTGGRGCDGLLGGAFPTAGTRHEYGKGRNDRQARHRGDTDLRARQRGQSPDRRRLHRGNRRHGRIRGLLVGRRRSLGSLRGLRSRHGDGDSLIDGLDIAGVLPQAPLRLELGRSCGRGRCRSCRGCDGGVRGFRGFRSRR